MPGGELLGEADRAFRDFLGKDLLHMLGEFEFGLAVYHFYKGFAWIVHVLVFSTGIALGVVFE